MNSIVNVIRHSPPFLSLFLGACLNPAPAHRATPPARVELRLVRQDFVPRPLPTRREACAALAGPGEELWLFAAYRDTAPKFAHRSDGHWSDWQPLAEPPWCIIRGLVVEPDADGQPVVIGVGRDCTGSTALPEGTFTEQAEYGPDLAIVATRWTGTAWTPFAVIDQWRGSYGSTHLCSLRDAQGRIHVVYERTLDPREEYAVGFPIVDGVFPSKCAHAVFDGQNWSSPQFTTGRGRYDLKPVLLSEGPEGLVLSFFAYDYQGLFESRAALAYQMFDGRSWSGLTWVTHGVFGPVGVIADSWGSRLVTYGGWNSRKLQPQKPRVTYFEAPESGRRTVPADVASDWPLVSTDAVGRIALLGPTADGGKSLRIWNGATWSAELAGFPGVDWFLFGRSHAAEHILLYYREPEGFALYEIAVETPPTAGTPLSRVRR